MWKVNFDRNTTEKIYMHNEILVRMFVIMLKFMFVKQIIQSSIEYRLVMVLVNYGLWIYLLTSPAHDRVMNASMRQNEYTN